MNPGGGHPPPLPPPPPFMGDRGGGGGHHHHHHHPPQHPPPPPLPPLGHAHGSSHSHSGGGHPPHNHQHNGPPAKWHSFKLLVDPMIHEGAAKMIRYDGNIVPGNPHHISPTPTDPRKRLPSAMWKRLEPMELTVPRFKVDENYVGEPPKVEVTIENLNDNVDKAFLQSMVSKFGAFEEMVIHYHPVTKKHLGLARLVFEEVKSAKECVKSLHCKSVMGKSLNCYIDPFGSSCKKMFTDLTTEKKPEAPPPPPPPPEDSPPITAEEIKKSLSLGDDKMKKHRDHHHHASSPPSRSEESKWGGGSGSSGHHRDRDPRGYDHPRESRHSRERGDRRRSDYNHDRHDYPSHSSRDSSSRHYSDRDRDSGRDLRDGNSRDSSRDDRDHHHHHNRSSSRDYSRHSSSENRDYLQVQQQPPPPLQQQQYEGDQQLPPEYWLQQAQQFAAQAQKHSSRANSQDSDQGLPPLPPSLHHPRLHEQQQMSSPHVPHVQHIPAPLGEPPDLHQDLAGSPPPGNNEDEGGGGGLNLIPSSSGQLATAALNNSDDGGDSDSNNKVDLDTRLKMLMTSGPDNIPAFLQFDKSDSESEQEEEKPALVEEEMEALAPPQYLVTAAHLSQMFPLEPDEVPLSRPPSPFIGTEEYHQCHKQWLEEKRARTNPHGGNNGRLSRQSDKMSLSSLSSEDNKILEQGPDTSYPPPPPGYHGYYPPGYPGSQWPAAPPPPPPGGDYASHHQYYSQHHPGYDSTYPYAMGEEFYGHDGQKWGETQGGYPPGQKYTKDTFRPILEEAVNDVVRETKRILEKDINKRICENYAFHLYENWWTEQEQKYKLKQQKSHSKSSNNAAAATSSASGNVPPDAVAQLTAAAAASENSNQPSTSAASIANDIKMHDQDGSNGSRSNNKPSEDLSTLFDRQRESFLDSGTKGPSGGLRMGGSLGFGFRGTIPKMPSFKIKKKTTSGKEDSRKKDSRRGNRGDSSDEDRGKRSPSSSSKSKKVSDKRKEQERRRDERLEKEKQKSREGDEKSDRHHKKSSKEDDSAESKKKKSGTSNSLESIYSTIYSSDGAKASIIDSDSDYSDDLPKKAGSKSPPSRKGKKKASPRRRRRSSASNSIVSNSGSSSKSSEASSAISTTTTESESEEASEAASVTSKSAAGGSTGSSSSSEADSISEGEKEAMTKQKKVAKARKPVEVPEEIAEETAAVKSPEQDVDVEEETTSAPIPSKQSKQASKAAAGEKSSSSSSSTSSSSSSSSSNSSTETDNETAIAEGGDERLEEENSLEVHKKPVPVRRPSVIKATQNGETLPASTPAAPAIQIPEESPPHIMDHCYAKPSSEKRPPAQRNTFENQFANDHGYTRPRTPPRGGEPGDDDVFDTVPAPPPTESKVSVAKAPANRAKAGRKPSATKETKATSKKALAKAVGANRAAAAAAVAVPQRVKSYPMRAMPEEYNVLFKFLTNGLDLEDINFLKRSYDRMLNDSQHDDRLYYLNDTHWVDHSITEIPDPPKKKRKDDFSRAHTTGSCRTEGYYKMDPREKARTKYHLHRSDADVFDQFRLANYEGSATKGKIQTAQSLSREARNNQRRQLAVLGDEVLNSDLLKFNQLKFRRKQMTFGKSSIHDWGLFAQEDIGPDEMVIEYVGHVVRPVLSDVRETRYEKQGIGSSYLFRIDLDYVVDATKCGNLARFINHSCDPNCYAKVVTLEGAKKIVIYSKQPIAVGEEITYDYKFPIEDEKILCLCATKSCRKYLN